MSTEFGTKVRELRKNKNITQAELAQLVNRTPASICRLEKTGQRMRDEPLRTLCAAIDGDFEELKALRDGAYDMTELASTLRSMPIESQQQVMAYVDYLNSQLQGKEP